MIWVSDMLTGNDSCATATHIPSSSLRFATQGQNISHSNAEHLYDEVAKHPKSLTMFSELAH